jgi:hypothetical protein
MKQYELSTQTELHRYVIITLTLRLQDTFLPQTNELLCFLYHNKYRIWHTHNLSNSNSEVSEVVEYGQVLTRWEWIFGRSLAGIAGWNTVGTWMSVCCDCRVFSGRNLCDGPITGPEESYRMLCVWMRSRNLVEEA